MAPKNICECFACDIPNLDTIKIKKRNGRLLPESKVVLNCISEQIRMEKKSDGSCLIEVKANRRVERPLQIINLLDDGEKSSYSEKTKIVLGEGSQISIIFCDDTLPKTEAEIEHNIKIEMGPCSNMSFYKMENVNNNTSIRSNIVFDLASEVFLQTFFLSLNGGKLSNDIKINFNDAHSEADLNGLYLMDRRQSVSTKVKVCHYKDACKSTQLFKGILDDEARADFLGHIVVDYNAKSNVAMQTNNNILLTDKAKVNTHPVLEIYNDDVQCSHGATTGQLDENALYYLKTRGISERQAKMLLMRAFCENVLLKSNIKGLQEGLSELIRKRLEGELTLENPFKINL